MSEMRNLIKKVTEAIKTESDDQASLLKLTQKKVSQKAQKGIIKKNKAARIISKLHKLFNDSSNPEKVAEKKKATAKKAAPKKTTTKKATTAKKTSTTKKTSTAKKAAPKKTATKAAEA